jgi:ribosomal protein S6
MTTIEAELEASLVDVEDEEAPETAVYEVGYHLVPTVSEEEINTVVQGIIDSLKAESTDFVGERFPSKIQLAYPITKRVGDTRTPFETAYFGWIAFVAPTFSIARIKSFLDANPQILRYLIVKTSRDAVAAAMTGTVVTPTGTIEKPKRNLETGGELSEEALEEALKTIAKEDEKTSE